ncbi:MAG: histidinol-phosphate transaminase [Kiritimatiellae bacterium]|nr:histidinol-phosphate transaminase [Kiritimatiellia bacterium]
MSTLIRQSVQRMTGYVPGEQREAADLIKLNTNENPYPPSPKVGAALAALDGAALRRYPDPVCATLRRRIGERHGCGVEQVFVSNGGDEALALCTRAFVENDGAIGYFDPSYSLYPILADIRGVERRPVALGERFEWQMPAGYAAALFFLTNPNAPTGLLYPRATVRAFCERFPGVVVIDEAYVDFAVESCLELALQLRNVLVLRTFSKAYALAGIRAGYVVGSEPLIGALFTIKDSYNVNRFTQTAALAAFEDEAYVRETIARILATRARLSGALERRRFEVFPSQTNFLWAKPAGIAAKTLFEELRKRNILIRYFPGRRTGDFVRVSIGTDQEVDRLLAAVDSVLGRQTAG